MFRPRVIIADIDEDYIKPLQFKFIKDFFDKIDLEIITEKEYFDELFSKSQKVDILIVSEELYDSSLQKHNITDIFIMMEQLEEIETAELNVNRLFKYTNVNEIFNEIIGKSAGALDLEIREKQETKIILVTSASGGVGKTTIAMGVSACLTKNYKRVLYLNASRLQCFHHMLDNNTSITSAEVYTRLVNPTEQIYDEIKHTIRKEMFSYLPAFKASLMSVGLKYSIFEQIALSAKKSGEFDFIVIDAESTFDEYKTRLLDLADKVVLVTRQSVSAIEATNLFVNNVNGINSDKYFFVCNQFDKEKLNPLILPNITIKFSVNDYVEKLNESDVKNAKLLLHCNGIQKVSFLIM